jgi:sporulation protein YlmC with PRC-barrel domain
MSTPKVRFEDLLGKMVRDPEGAKVGRIFSAHAEIEGKDCIVREYVLGKGGLLERFGISCPERWKPLRVPWDLLDVRDPAHPRLRCSAEELAGRAQT